MGKHHIARCILISAVLLLAAPAVHAKVLVDGAVLFGGQILEFERTKSTADENLNFNDPRLNLYLDIDIFRNLRVYTELWAANDWTHDNNSFNSSLNDALELRKMYLTVNNVLGSPLGFKIGRFDIPFGHEYTTRTDNADGRDNPFVTNSLLDINGVDEGISVFGAFDLGMTASPLTFDLAVFNGGPVPDGNARGNNGGRSNSSLGLAFQSEVGLMDNLNLQVSVYMNDQRKDKDDDPLSVGNTLMQNALRDTGNLGGLSRATTFVDTAGTLVGFDRTLFELSSRFRFGSIDLLAFLGTVAAHTDTDAIGRRRWSYMGVQGKYDVTPNVHLALRYTQLDPGYASAGAQGHPSMWSFAAGYKLNTHSRIKLEYSYFDEGSDAFGAGGPTPDNTNDDAQMWSVAVDVDF